MEQKKDDPPKRPRVWPGMPTRGTQFFESFGIVLPALVALIVLAAMVVKALMLRAIHP